MNWDIPNKLVTIDTARSKALIGKLPGKPVTLGDVTIEPLPNSQDWAAITLTLMEGESFTSKGARILVTATGNHENTDQKWNDEKKDSVGRNWGKAPSLVEPIPAKLSWKIGGPRPHVYRLNERGQRDIELPITQEGDSNIVNVVNIGPQGRTLWYEIVME